MNEIITIRTSGLKEIRKINPLLVSFNVEMAEVTGGTFWKEYTPEQIAGAEPFYAGTDAESALQVYPPVNLYEENIRTLAKALGPSYIRVSGSWCTTTFVDLNNETNGTPPSGYKSVLSREQWIGVLDFVKAVDGKLLISVDNCEGNHSAEEPWDPARTMQLLDFSRAYGVPVSAAEFTNEPNGYNMTGTPAGYTPEQFGRDQDLFFRFLHENYPEITTVGPSACFDSIENTAYAVFTQHELFHAYPTKALLDACTERADAFSYHLYYGLSERGAAFGGHWNAEDALSEQYLNTVDMVFRFYEPLRNQYAPGSEIWITEDGDAACGGNTWACTCMEMVRAADEIGRFARLTNGILFHNTLAASTYGYLDQKTHLPRPSYWVAWLWKHLMGDVVYDAEEPIREGAHVFSHSRKDGREGYSYVLINNSRDHVTEVLLPQGAEIWQLTGKFLRSETALLNGQPLIYHSGSGEPVLNGLRVPAGSYFLPPVSVTFLLV